MDGYQKPIINPNKSYVQPPKKNVVQSVPPKVEEEKPAPVSVGTPNDSMTVEEAISNMTEKFEKDPILTVPAKKSDEEILKDIAEEAKEYAEGNEDIQKIREIQEKEYEGRDIKAELTPSDAIDDPSIPEGLVAANREFNVDASGKPIFTREAGTDDDAADVDILHTEDLDSINDEKFKEAFLDTTAKIHQISDEGAVGLLDVMMAYKHDKSISVYGRLPEEIKTQVKQICLSSGIPMANANKVAKMMIEQLIAETAQDNTFIDFEKSLNEAMKIPSLVDMYEEHMGETMGEKIPAMAAAIEKEDPEKAQMLRDVATRYEWARDFTFARKMYDEVTLIRKAVRRDFEKSARFADELNFMNKNSKFRMPDATTLRPILMKVLANDEDNDITVGEVDKFLVLIFKSCDNLKKDELVDAAYIYYLLKNISMLSYINENSTKAADTFSAELISNIKTLIYYIRAKEAAFYANNQPAERKPKRSKRKRK